MATHQSTLTVERLRALLHYDPETGVFTRRVGVKGAAAGTIAGDVTGHGYGRIAVDYMRYHAHRLAWFHFYGRWPVGDVDHINGVRTDNRIANLREGSRGDNMQNQRAPRRDNRSGLLGVEVHRTGRFTARIKANGKRYYLGIFDTPEEAHAAYIAAKRRLHSFCTI